MLSSAPDGACSGPARSPAGRQKAQVTQTLLTSSLGERSPSGDPGSWPHGLRGLLHPLPPCPSPSLPLLPGWPPLSWGPSHVPAHLPPSGLASEVTSSGTSRYTVTSSALLVPSVTPLCLSFPYNTPHRLLAYPFSLLTVCLPHQTPSSKGRACARSGARSDAESRTWRQGCPISIC